MKGLFIWLVAVIVVFVLLTKLPPETADNADPYLVGLIGGSLFGSSIIMLAFTKHWGLRSIGLMSVGFGIGVLYTGSLLIYAVPETVKYAETMRNAGRSLLGVGGPLLFIALVAYVWGYMRAGKDHKPALETTLEDREPNTTKADGEK